MNEGYQIIRMCRSCGSENLTQFEESASLPVAGIYYDELSDPINLVAPVNLLYCNHCGLTQLRETINPSIYNDYSFVGNVIPSYEEYLKQLANEIRLRLGSGKKRIFEIGASNGALLKMLKESGNHMVNGIEPSWKLCEYANKSGVNITQGFFNTNYVTQYTDKYDCIIMRHVLEHIDDLNEMLTSIRCILKKDGLLILEVPDLGEIIRRSIYSNIYHEHLNYFSDFSINHLLNRHGFKVNSSKIVPIHGGSMLLFIHLEDSNKSSVDSSETNHRNELCTYIQQSSTYFNNINKQVHAFVSKGKIIHGYGASHRTFILMGRASLDDRHIPVIYDLNPYLHNKKLNAINSIVKPTTEIQNRKPDAVIIFATSYEDEIKSLLSQEHGYEGEILSISRLGVAE